MNYLLGQIWEGYKDFWAMFAPSLGFVLGLISLGGLMVALVVIGYLLHRLLVL